MVQLKKNSKNQDNTKLIAIGAGGVFVLIMGVLMTGQTSSTSMIPLTQLSESLNVARNGRELKDWRQTIREKCKAAASLEELDAIDLLNSDGFSFPDKNAVPQQPRGDEAVKRCRRVVMDFGANIGDTSGHVIDSGMNNCYRKDLEGGTKRDLPHFNVQTKEFEMIKKRNPLTLQFTKLMETQNEPGTTEEDMIGPEDYCYYGVEGNPVFTERLQGIEDSVMAIRPRPIQHMHFFTESVGAGEDGMTKLYLDTINTKENFWGSSIFKDHQDVKKSIDKAGGKVETIAADVMGYTIGTLMKKTLTAFDPNNPNPNEKNHLILKVDIEGGEYPLLHQAVEDGTLCKFVKEMGHTADLFIEFHSVRVTGKHDHVGQTKKMKDALTACGVTFRNLAAWWA